MGGARILDVEVDRFWELWQRGLSLRGVARLTGHDLWSVRKVIGAAGGIRPPAHQKPESAHIVQGLTCEPRPRIIVRMFGLMA